MSIRNRHESSSITLRARYIFPVTGHPIRDGWVTIAGDRIVACGAGVPPASTEEKVGWVERSEPHQTSQETHGGARRPALRVGARRPTLQEFCDLGNVAILPGLVNAHVHLDFSDLANPIGEPGIGFADWIRRVMLFRRKTAATAQHPVSLGDCPNFRGHRGEAVVDENGTVPFDAPVSLGLQESLRCGVTTLGDIAQPGWPADEMAASPLSVTGLLKKGTGSELTDANAAQDSSGEVPVPFCRQTVTVFQELIAPTAERVAGALALAQSHAHRIHCGSEWDATCRVRRADLCIDTSPLTVREADPTGFSQQKPHDGTMPLANVRPGLSPHSPFTVHPELLSAVISLSAAEHIPVAMHLAESREELELLRHGTGPLRALLEELGAWDATTIRPGSRPMDYLRLLASASRALVIHGSYLDDDEIAFIGTNRERMSVVYCPRTHEWFARGEYPLEKMHAAGVTVALGTDGRGSSPDLSLLGEMRFAARRHPAVGLDRILQMGTILGAKALGLDRHIGSLEPGKQADLTIVALPDRDAADPHELLFASDEPVTACYCRGVLA